MSVTLTIYDETLTGERTPRLTLDFVESSIKLSDLLCQRVCQEVQHYNQCQPEYFRGLVQPNGSEPTLQGYKLPKQRLIDPKQQYQKALQVFERSGFMILVNDCAVEDLDAEIDLSHELTVSFLRTYLKAVPGDDLSQSQQSIKKPEPFIKNMALSLTHFFKGLLPYPLRPKRWAGIILGR
jgi:hypothetical protein